MSRPVCHIVCAGPCEQLTIELAEDDLLIAADGGYLHCMDAGLAPDIFIGDMDSLPADMAAGISCTRIELPCEKDDTDTMAACKLGLERGYDRFCIHASLGGDVGHEISNIQLLAYLDGQGAQGVLTGSAQTVCLVTPKESPVVFEAPIGTRVSVFSFGEQARGVCERGLHWELEDATLENCLPVGVSNVTREECFELAVSAGALLVVIG